MHATKHLSSLLVITWLVIPIISSQDETLKFYSSYCKNEFGLFTCTNIVASDDGQMKYIDSTHASVEGLWVIWKASSDREGEFIYQENFGLYRRLGATFQDVGRIKQLRPRVDPRVPSITLAFELSLLTDSVWYFSESTSMDCDPFVGNGKSLVIHGSEPWELVLMNKTTSVCIQVEATTTYVPGIVMDVRQLGIPLERPSLCAVLRGCSKPNSEIIRIPNNITQGPLHIPE